MNETDRHGLTCTNARRMLASVWQRVRVADYAGMFEFDFLTEEIRAFSDRKLSSFFDGWDSPPLPLWLTGLILGYPVENTISIYLQ